VSDSPDFFDELSSEALRSGGAVLDSVAAILEVSDSERLRVLELGAYMATLGAPSGKVIRVFRAPEEPSELQALVERVVEHNPKVGSELVIVGGSARHTEAIEAAIPELLMHPFVAFQRTDSGAVRSFPAGKGQKSLRYSALERVRVLSEPERRKVLVQIEEHARSLQNDQRERSRFFRSMSTRPPRATYALLVAIAFTYLLQLVWGPKAGEDGAEDVFFIAMGALFRPMVMDGEWWRMISVGFLHGNLMHLGVNSFVLYLLGGQTERVIGTSRFLILYTTALLGGSFASLYFGHGFSVGASGAVWGLLGAQVALAYGRPPVLPTSIAESLKPMAKQNLLINVGISFLPGIDAAAHFGGGITGALVLASGVLYRSSSGASESRGPEAARLLHGEPAFTPYAATACVALLLGGLVAGITTWQPWELSGKLEERLEELLSTTQP
jgi:membrane associated rhomboid family serine protease